MVFVKSKNQREIIESDKLGVHQRDPRLIIEKGINPADQGYIGEQDDENDEGNRKEQQCEPLIRPQATGEFYNDTLAF